MREFLTKVWAFFAKEFHDVRRQPRLMLSLIGGPLLVLGAFGATFRSANPFVRTVLVWPEEGIPGVPQEQAIRFIEANFALTGVTSDEAEAMRMLEAGETDVVQIVPTVTAGTVVEGERPEIRWISRTIDPNAEAWIRSLAYGEVNFINQQLLATEAVKAQDKAREVSASLAEALTGYRNLGDTLDPQQIDQALALTTALSDQLSELLAFLPPDVLAQANCRSWRRLCAKTTCPSSSSGSAAQLRRSRRWRRRLAPSLMSRLRTLSRRSRRRTRTCVAAPTVWSSSSPRRCWPCWSSRWP
jgi:ABC-2 type transport system permease protein